MKSIIVNMVPEETCMALLEDGELQAVEMERSSHSHLVGNIYKGRVQNVLPGMQAAFVDIGTGKNAFLYIGDGLPHETIASMPQNARIHIGQSLPIQIVKDAIGTKGPRATMHISLPGRNVVLMPTAAYIGMSRRIEDEAERARLHAIAERICPKGMGLIIRTVAAGQSEQSLAADVRYLVRLWESILARYKLKAKGSTLLYRDADLLIRLVRDRFTADIDELVIDNEEAYQRVRSLVEANSPELVDRIRFYEAKTPIFKAYHIEEEIEKLGAREVELKSGGFLVIDKTEALTVIDVNTGKYVGKTNLGDTVYQTNLEAAAEITRKKTRQNIDSIVYSECPICHGRGRIESPETVAIRISRDIRRMERKSHAREGYEIEVHETVAEELQANQLMLNLAAEFGTDIKVTVKPGMHPENYTILQQS